MPLINKIAWLALAAFAACCLAVLALQRGETVNAAWVIAATIAIQVIGYRFYSRYIADRVLGLDAARPTPAVRRDDGLDYVPTDRWVVFGHHFAAIAGAGPLVGPVLAAQMGYLPGLLWIAGRRGAGRRGAGLHHPVPVAAPRRPFARRHDPRGNRPGRRHPRAWSASC